MDLLPKSKQRKYLLGAVSLVAILIAASVIAKTIVPGLYERYGYHPEQDAREWMGLAVSYAGASSCKDCHDEKHAEWRASVHRTVNCEACHGPAAAHIQGEASLSTGYSNELCELCHAKIPGRPRGFAQVYPDEHAGQSPCVECHSPHSPAIRE